MFVCDSGGGKYPTVTERAWTIVGGEPGLTTTMTPYQTKDTYRHPVVSAVTKAYITGEDEPVLLLVHHATFITKKHDPDEVESLMTTNDIGYHGVKINGIHPNDEKCGITVKGKYLPFDSNEQLGTGFFRIGKPTEEELGIYPIYELNSPVYPEMTLRRKRSRGEYESGIQQELPISEMRKRFAMLPEDTVRKTLETHNAILYGNRRGKSNQSGKAF